MVLPLVLALVCSSEPLTRPRIFFLSFFCLHLVKRLYYSFTPLLPPFPSLRPHFPFSSSSLISSASSFFNLFPLLLLSCNEIPSCRDQQVNTPGCSKRITKNPYYLHAVTSMPHLDTLCACTYSKHVHACVCVCACGSRVCVRGWAGESLGPLAKNRIYEKTCSGY